METYFKFKLITESIGMILAVGVLTTVGILVWRGKL